METRYFLAIEVDDHVKVHVKELQDRVKDCEADVKLVEPENLHFTVKFLGNLDQTTIRRVIDVLTPPLECEFTSKVSVQGIGSFGPSSSPRIIWAGVSTGKPYLAGLFGVISEKINDLGLKTDEKEQIPHITIGRVRSDKNISKLKEIISKESETFFGETEITAIKLKTSRLTPSGPEYSDVHVFLLKRRP
ncbi:MAG: RNA 2',3'-cyclic phosphodiesterase [Candidatus Aenigmatarchaeota archaeon]